MNQSINGIARPRRKANDFSDIPVNVVVHFFGQPALSSHGNLFTYESQSEGSVYYTSIFRNVAGDLPHCHFYTSDQVALDRSDVLIFVDLPLFKTELDSIVREAKSHGVPILLILMESFLGRHEVFRESNLDFADYVLTYDSLLCLRLKSFGIRSVCYKLPSLDRHFRDNESFAPYKSQSSHMRINKAVFLGSKKKMGFMNKNLLPCACLFRGWKPPASFSNHGRKPLVHLRDKLVQSALSKAIPVDIYGSGWRSPVNGCLGKPYHGSKVNLLSRYNASICIENFDADGYVTEKVGDSLLAGAYPVYAGSNSISRYIPTDLFLKFNGMRELRDALNYILSLDAEQINSWRYKCMSFIFATGLKEFRHYDLALKLEFVIDNV